MTKWSATRRLFVGGGLVAGAVGAPAGAANETLKTIDALHSTHGNFLEKPVADADLDRILAASVRAANASNMQSYSIVISKDPAKIQKITTYRAPCLLLFCADYTRLTDVARHLGHDYRPTNMESFVTSSTNTALAAQTAVIAARSLGIDSLLTNGIHRGDLERLWTILDLPQEGCFPLIALLLGYEKQAPAHRKGRLQGPGIFHHEKYQRLSPPQLEALVRQHDDPAQQLGQIEDWAQKGHKHYLDWFYKDWLRVGSPAPAEGPTFRRLKKSGFLDGLKA